MKIRTITVFTDSLYDGLDEIFHKAALLRKQAEHIFSPLDIQTVRIALRQHFSHIARAGSINQLGDKYNIPFISLGMYDKNTHSERIIEIIDKNKNLSLSYNCSTESDVKECSEIISELACKDSMNNFRFAGSINIEPFTPFFPAAYAGNGLSFALGFEWGDLLHKTFSENTEMNYLEETLIRVFSSIERNCLVLENESGIQYRGMDMSLNPSVEETGSIAYSYDKVTGSFGSRLTLALTKGITDILGDIPVEKAGYCGVMFPVLEDRGLAHYWSKGNIDIDKLILYSSVCGCGLDMIPLPGNVSTEDIHRIILDLKAISDRYTKPLSARLLPVKGKDRGAATAFESPYLVNTII
ncbi:MAG: DUF711 family protein [bacterium]